MTDPANQINTQTGDITSDQGEVIPFNDCDYFRFGSYLYPAHELVHYAYQDHYDKKQKLTMNAGKVTESFNAFINENQVNEEDMLLATEPEQKPQECEGCSDHPDTLSDVAKDAIKRVCNEILIKEAHVCETSDDPSQTYESFLRECTHYLAECLIRASQNLKV
jgi:hypothetical protein